MYLNREIRFSCIWGWILIQRCSKLLLGGDGPFQVIEKINDNVYKLDLLGEYNVKASSNIAGLSPFDVGEDLQTNPFQEGGMIRTKLLKLHKDPLILEVQ